MTIIRTSISRMSDGFVWMLYSWTYAPDAQEGERLEFRILGEGHAPSREEAADDALEAPDRHAPSSPLEDRIAAGKAINVPLPPSASLRGRRWAIVYLSPGHEAKRRAKELAELTGPKKMVFVQAEAGRLYHWDGTHWSTWLVTGTQGNSTFVLELGADGMLAPDGIAGTVSAPGLSKSGRASLSGFTLMTATERAALQSRMRRHRQHVARQQQEQAQPGDLSRAGEYQEAGE